MGLGHYMGGDEWVSWGHSEYTHLRVSHKDQGCTIYAQNLLTILKWILRETHHIYVIG